MFIVTIVRRMPIGRMLKVVVFATMDGLGKIVILGVENVILDVTSAVRGQLIRIVYNA